MPENASLPVGKLDMELLTELIGQVPRDGSVILGPGVGCDVAVIDNGGSNYLLLKSDPITFATDEIGHYAVTVNVNDIATAGGLPRWLLATLLLPEKLTAPETVRTVFEQLKAVCRHYAISLVGGHTEITYGIDRPIVVCSVVGEVPRERLVTSSGAQPGDAILLTKGIAVEGTSLIAREKRDDLLAGGLDAAFVDGCAGMLHEPGIGVLTEAQAACSVGGVHAMHDPTEGGVATGLWEMAVASDVGLRVEERALPVYPETRTLCEHFGLDPLGLIASGSLLLAVAQESVGDIVQACAQTGVPCARIGTAVSASEGCALLREGEEAQLPRFDQDEIGKLFA